MDSVNFWLVVSAGLLTTYIIVRIWKWVAKSIKSKKQKALPTCFNCEFHTPYQMLNNRDERVNVNHCSILSARIKSIHSNYIADMAVSVNDPETFSCNQHKPK